MIKKLCSDSLFMKTVCFLAFNFQMICHLYELIHCRNHCEIRITKNYSLFVSIRNECLRHLPLIWRN